MFVPRFEVVARVMNLGANFCSRGQQFNWRVLVKTFVSYLSVVTLFAALEAANGLRANTLCIYVDGPAGAPNQPGTTAHVFVQLRPTAGPQVGSSNLVYGYYPGTRNIFGGAGRVCDDSSRHWDWRICYPLTIEQ